MRTVTFLLAVLLVSALSGTWLKGSTTWMGMLPVRAERVPGDLRRGGTVARHVEHEGAAQVDIPQVWQRAGAEAETATARPAVVNSGAGAQCRPGGAAEGRPTSEVLTFKSGRLLGRAVKPTTDTATDRAERCATARAPRRSCRQGTR